MFIQSIRMLRDSNTSESTKQNVVEVINYSPSAPTAHSRIFLRQTLIPLLRDLLLRQWINYSADLTMLLTGSVHGDVTFTDFVSAIDIILASPSSSLSFKRKTLQLALAIVSSVGQSTIGAYFLRRDFFSTIVKVSPVPCLYGD